MSLREPNLSEHNRDTRVFQQNTKGRGIKKKDYLIGKCKKKKLI